MLALVAIDVIAYFISTWFFEIEHDESSFELSFLELLLYFSLLKIILFFKYSFICIK